LRRADFIRAQRDGISVRSPHATLLFLRRDDGQAARLGIVASRRVGAAVIRNRVKRRIREWFRRKCWPPALDVVVIPRFSAASVPATDFWAALDEASAKGTHKACGKKPRASS
jgi:ribonuclease P protein component